MATPVTPEYWLRGPVNGIPALLQPAAHTLLQARDEVTESLKVFPDEKLWEKPEGLASVGFHLQHLRGVLDRLFTYAKGEQLSQRQLTQLANEGKPYAGNETVKELLAQLHGQVEEALEQLRSTDEKKLTAIREVGRAKIPSTVTGLLFHAAEHTMRHTGQLLVTVKVVNNRV
ncbi:MAG: DinB family protein [Chitinophagaceae bacterium]|nr:DinB family protein [Chitinophagaceae bacterium]